MTLNYSTFNSCHANYGPRIANACTCIVWILIIYNIMQPVPGIVLVGKIKKLSAYLCTIDHQDCAYSSLVHTGRRPYHCCPCRMSALCHIVCFGQGRDSRLLRRARQGKRVHIIGSKLSTLTQTQTQTHISFRVLYKEPT